MATNTQGKKKAGKGDKKAAKAAHSGWARTKMSKEHRHCGPIGYYLRTGIKRYTSN